MIYTRREVWSVCFIADATLCLPSLLTDTVSFLCVCLLCHCLPASSKWLLFNTKTRDASLLYLSRCFILFLSCRLLLQASEFAKHYFSLCDFSDKQSVLSYREVTRKSSTCSSLLVSAVYRQFRWSVALKWFFWQEGLLNDTGVIDPAAFDEQTLTDCHFHCLLGVFFFFPPPAIGSESQSHFRVVNPPLAGKDKPGECYLSDAFRRAQIQYGHRTWRHPLGRYAWGFSVNAKRLYIRQSKWNMSDRRGRRPSEKPDVKFSHVSTWLLQSHHRPTETFWGNISWLSSGERQISDWGTATFRKCLQVVYKWDQPSFSLYQAKHASELVLLCLCCGFYPCFYLEQNSSDDRNNSIYQIVTQITHQVFTKESCWWKFKIRIFYFLHYNQRLNLFLNDGDFGVNRLRRQ